MDVEIAQKILGVSLNATASEITDAFRQRAKTAHSDRGGSDATMSELLEARRTLLGAFSESTELVSINAVREVVKLVTGEVRETALLDSRVNVTKSIIHTKSVNRLKQYRATAAIFAAIFAASMFLGKEIPVDVMMGLDTTSLENVSATAQRAISRLEAEDKAARQDLRKNSALIKKNAAEIKLEKDTLEQTNFQIAQIKRAQTNYANNWKFASIFVAMCAGFFAWFTNALINRAEMKLSELDEHTASKTFIFQLLREIFLGKIPELWTLSELMAGVERWSGEHGRFNMIVHDVGAFHFSQYLLGRAKQLEMIKVIEDISANEYVERFAVRAS